MQPRRRCTFAVLIAVALMASAVPADGRGAPGEACSHWTDCSSLSCMKGICCKPGVDYPCLACGSDGNCQECDNNLLPLGEQCLKQPPGGPCSTDEGCSSSICLGGKCCKSDVDGSCSACDIEGECQECVATHYLLFDICIKRSEVGFSCSYDAQCVSSHCLTRCCYGDRYRNCVLCDCDGFCRICEDSYLLERGRCTAKMPGTLCSKDDECPSSTCLNFHCCKENVTRSDCLACDDNGECSSYKASASSNSETIDSNTLIIVLSMGLILNALCWVCLCLRRRSKRRDGHAEGAPDHLVQRSSQASLQDTDPATETA